MELCPNEVSGERRMHLRISLSELCDRFSIQRSLFRFLQRKRFCRFKSRLSVKTGLCFPIVFFHFQDKPVYCNNSKIKPLHHAVANHAVKLAITR